MNIKCKLGLHKYEKKEEKWVKIEADLGAAIKKAEIKMEKHKCLKCGKEKNTPKTKIANRFAEEKKVKRNEKTIWKNEQ